MFHKTYWSSACLTDVPSIQQTIKIYDIRFLNVICYKDVIKGVPKLKPGLNLAPFAIHF